jgi:hypothetical protein
MTSGQPERAVSGFGQQALKKMADKNRIINFHLPV